MFDQETWQAVDRLAEESMKTIQELADSISDQAPTPPRQARVLSKRTTRWCQPVVAFILSTLTSSWLKVTSMRSALFAVVLLHLGSGSIAAADLKAISRIDSVTVFPQGAEITRTAKIKLEAGETAIVISDLPGQAIATSIRVEGTATGKLEIGSVDAKRSLVTSEDPGVAQSARRRIEGEIEAQRDQRALEDNVIQSAKAQRALLDNLGKLRTVPSPAGGSAPREDWNNLFGLIGSRMTEVTKIMSEATLRQRAIDRKIADLEKELAATAPKQFDRTEVRINAAADAPLEATLTIRYQVVSASWTPLYDARLTTGDKATPPRLSLSRRATIRQSTSEDWNDVALALSTTRPGHATAAPELNMLNVDFEAPPPTVAAAAPPMRPAPMAAPSGLARREMESAAEDAHRIRSENAAAPERRDLVAAEQKAVANIGDFQTVFDVPGKQTLKSSQDAKRVAIATEDIDAQLIVRTVPRLDQTAYLYTKLALSKAAAPVLAGQVALFRDGVFVGNGRIAALAPGEEHEIGFGADNRVKVKRVTLEDKKGETGTFTTSRIEERNFEITVKNLHPRPVTVQVLDRVPVSSQQEIKVEPAYRSSQPTKKDNNDRRGTSLWELVIDPDQEKRVTFGYRVTWPTDKKVRYQEKTPEQIMQQNVVRY